MTPDPEDAAGGDPTRLTAGIGWMAVVLGAVTAAVYMTYGSGPKLTELVWFNAFGLTFQAVTSAAVSYIAFGRYRVLRDATSYWVGVAFIGYGVALTMYILVWPGVRPDGGSLLADLSGTAAWFTILALFELWFFLQLGAWTSARPHSRLPTGSWVTAALAITALTVAIGWFMIAIERRLPQLVDGEGAFTPLLVGVYAVQLLLLAYGTVSSTRRARRAGDTLLAVTAGLQLALLFAIAWVVIGAERYGLWWYMARILLAAAALVVLFGSLAEHVRLLRQEREKSRALAAAESKLLESVGKIREANLLLRQQDDRKDQFLATLAHELRNPLAPIQTSIDILKRAAGDPSVLEQVLPIMERQMGHLKHLVDDLMDVSRITNDKIRLTRERVELTHLLKQTIDAGFSSLNRRMHVELPEEHLEVHGDPVRLTQIFSNLIDNAAKNTDAEQGAIRIRAWRDGATVAVAIKDNGVGLSADSLERVFTPFEQVEPGAGGLGLGLSLARRLAELHGGSIEATSAGPGTGSEFVVRLPAATAPEPPPTNGRTDQLLNLRKP